MSASTMRRLSRTTTMGRRGRRGATFIEWVILMPIFMFLILFVVDVGHMILVNGAMQDATYSAARAGAQVGGGGFNSATSKFYCTTTSTSTPCLQGVTYTRWKDTIANVPAKVSDADMYLVSGARCSTSGPNAYVTVTTTFTTKVLTPGMGAMLRMMNQNKDIPKSADANEWSMQVTATSRCEVTR